MFIIQIDGTPYSLEFRHKQYRGTRSVRAVTTCVLTGKDFIAIENAVCVKGDPFSREAGRRIAFRKIVDSIPRFRDAQNIVYPTHLRLLEAPAPPKRKAKLTTEQVSELVAAGWQTRRARDLSRNPEETEQATS